MPAPSAVRLHAIPYVVLSLLLLFSVVNFARDAAEVIDTVRHAKEIVREPFQPGDWNWGAVSLQPEAEEAGLKTGDAVLAVNGRPVDGFCCSASAGLRSGCAPGSIGGSSVNRTKPTPS